jgi:predicted  nucleic acid-binding Zn-ribbon protein
MALIEKFIELGKIDGRRIDLERKIARAPAPAQAEEARAKNARDTIVKLKEEGKRASLEMKKLEADVQAKQQDVEKTQINQNQAKQNEEYKLLGKKIETLKGEIDALEGKILEELERGDKRAADLAELEKSSKTIEQDAVAARKKVDADVKVLQAELEKVKAERTEALKGVDKDALGVYANVLKEHQDSAVVRVEGNVCGGCHISIRPQQISVLKGREQLVTCWQCGRILYLE